VRPDGNETFVQAGWLRASQRALAPDATVLRPVKTHLEADAELLPAGQYALTRVEVMPFGQVFRAGTKVRLVISTPGDSRERWRFKLLEYRLGALVEHQVAHSMVHPSSVVLPLIPSAVVPVANSPFPACPSSRGQSCRAHAAYSNTPGD
jgi:predicted acyl esterase